MNSKCIFLAILILLFSESLFCQEKENYSFEFNSISIKDALSKIELETNFHFYYAEEWVITDSIAKNYTNKSIDFILDDIFKNSSINYFIDENNRIVLTKSNYIYTLLPEGFFVKRSDTIVEEKEITKNVNPIFFGTLKTPSKQIGETVIIGKQSKNTNQKKYKLSGYITYSTSNSPIVDLAVLIKGKSIATTTDEDGYYELNLPAGVNILQTSAMGIQASERNVIIYNDGEFSFSLNESVEQLNEVVVAANAAKNIDETTTGSTTIDSEESKNIPLVLGERNILKIATSLPSVSSAGEGAAGFNVRGGKEDQNLVLLDNAVIYNPTHFFGIFQALNPFTTKDATIYAGSIPVEYGGRISSVFDIHSKDANTKKIALEASIGPVTGNIALEIPVIKDTSAILIGGRGTYSDWVLKALDDQELANSKASFYDLIVKYNHKINQNNEIKTTAYFSKDLFSITSDSLYSYSNRLFSFNWGHKFNEKNTGNIILANSQYKFNIDYDGESNDDFLLGYQVDETEVKLKMKYLYSKNHNFTYGLSGKYYSVTPGNISPSGNESLIEPKSVAKEAGLETALFASDSYEVNDKLLIDIGIRYSMFAVLGPSEQNIYAENVPKSESAIIETKSYDKGAIVKVYGGPEFRSALRYYLKPDLSLKASYNNSYQYINTLSNNTTSSPIDTWKLSDLNIKPQQGTLYSLGIYKNINSTDYELSLEGYYKKLKNTLDFKTGATLLLNDNIETEILQGKGKAYGAEFLLKKNTGKLNGWISYTYSRSFYKFDGDFREEQINNGNFFPSNFDKPHDLSVVANYAFTQRFSVSSNFVYQTGRPVTFPIGNYTFNNSDFVLYSNRNQNRIPDYYRLDLSFNVEGNHKKKKLAHSFWSLSIYNVLGRNNPYSVFFVTEDGEVKAYQTSIFTIPIPSLTYNLKF
tara:strand:- start:54742 stop:57513 length:2772 start_codon:yes stop_codon:yes gene_type:complete